MQAPAFQSTSASDIFFEATVEAAEVDELREFAFERGVGGGNVEWVGEDELAPGF